MSDQKNENEVSAYSYVMESIIIETHSGNPYEIKDLVLGITYYEDINSNFCSANVRVVDSGANLRGTGPVQGYEKVTIKVKGPDEVDYEYEMYVYRIGEVVITKNIQTYNLGLITKEALINEGRKVQIAMKDFPHAIVKKVLEEDLEVEWSDKLQFNFDKTVNKTAMIPGNKTPFTLCAMLQDKSMAPPPEGKRTWTGGVKGDGFLGPKWLGIKNPLAKSDGEATKGRAGFLFFRNAKGFNFRSINELCKVKKGEAKEFIDRPEGEVQPYTITSVEFLSEINIMEGLRMGAYCTELQTFNIDTGDFKKTTFSADAAFETQAHLGSSDSFTHAQTILSKTATRITSAIICNEAYYDGDKVASEESEYKDWTHALLPQTLSRNYILNTQALRIEVPGNLDLVVGDRVRVLLPNSVTQEDKKEEPTDTENSGYYLITKLSRFFDQQTKNVNTVLKLQRDSYGSNETSDESSSDNEVLLY